VGVGVVDSVHPGSPLKTGYRVIVFPGYHWGQFISCRRGLSPTYGASILPVFGGGALHGLE
jgi:hypothetical protein